MEAALGFGLAAAVAWGLAAYLSALAARQFGGWTTNLGALLATVAVLLPMGLLALGDRPAEPSSLDILVIAAVGVGTLLLDVLLFELLTVAPVAIILPIVAANGAVVAALAVFVLGESLTPLQTGGIVLVTAGVVAIAYRRPGAEPGGPSLVPETLPRGSLSSGGPKRSLAPVPRRAAARVVVAAILITLASGVLIFVITLFARRLGWYQPLIIDRVAQTGLVLGLLVLGFPPRRDLVGHGRRWWAILLVIGLLNAAAVAAYYLGLATSSAAITATVASTFAAIPVVLGIVRLGERPQRHQALGIAAALAGIIALGAG